MMLAVGGCANTFEQMDTNACGYRQADFVIFSDCIEKKLAKKNQDLLHQTPNQRKARHLEAQSASNPLTDSFIVRLQEIKQNYNNDIKKENHKKSSDAAYDSFDYYLADFKQKEYQSNQNAQAVGVGILAVGAVTAAAVAASNNDNSGGYAAPVSSCIYLQGQEKQLCEIKEQLQQQNSQNFINNNKPIHCTPFGNGYTCQ